MEVEILRPRELSSEFLDSIVSLKFYLANSTLIGGFTRIWRRTKEFVESVKTAESRFKEH